MARAPQPLTASPGATISALPADRIRLGDWFSLQRSIAGPVTQLMYLAGLGLICLVGFGVVGAFVGAALREATVESVLLAIPGLIGGVLAVMVAVLLWRWMCEFYVAVLQMAEDLSVLRQSAEGRAVLGDPDATMIARPAQRVTN